LGVGVWGPHPQTPNPQSPIPNPHSNIIIENKIYIKYINII